MAFEIYEFIFICLKNPWFLRKIIFTLGCILAGGNHNFQPFSQFILIDYVLNIWLLIKMVYETVVSQKGGTF